MKYWEEVSKNHFTLKAVINIKDYELCDLYLTPVTNTGDYICKTYIGDIICTTNNINPVCDVFSAYDLETAKAKAEMFVIKQISNKKDKLESELYRCDKMLDELK